MKSKKYTWLYIFGGLIVLFGLIQLVPYGKAHANPPVVNSPTWNTAQTTTLMKNACMDCHSNETVWPWYSNIAPASWLIQVDVDEGRSRMNLSYWPTNKAGQQGLVDEMVQIIQEGEMPPPQYLVIHKNARLTADEKSLLIQGLQDSVK